MAKRLDSRTLTVKNVKYQGMIFDAFIISNWEIGANKPDDFYISKIIAVSSGKIEKGFVHAALCDHFYHGNDRNKSSFVEKQLQECYNSGDIIKVLDTEKGFAEMDAAFLTAVNQFRASDIYIF